MINQRINGAIRYKSDHANWGMVDHWATPSDIARNGAGDCEDYAITKMWMLRALGFAPEQLQLVVVQDTRRRLYHAVLAVHIGGERYILDNLSNVARKREGETVQPA
jgi:predicted transglutaminase-like cysteine proteinase